MSELGRGWKAGSLTVIAIAIGIGCGGDTAAPPTTTLAPPTTMAPAPPSTAPAPPPTVPNAAAKPDAPRVLPAVEFAQGADLASVSNLRWKDDTKRQVAADIRLLKGPISSLWFVFQDGNDQVASGVLPGNAFTQDGMATAFMPLSTGLGAKGKEQVMDVSRANRLLIHVFGLPADAAAKGQPAWTGPMVTACEQGSAADCQTLAVAYRTGSSDKGSVTPDAALAERFSKRFVEMGERSCALGTPESCFVLGRAYISGEDVPADRDRGIALVQKACGTGVQAACDFQASNPSAFQAQPR